MGLRRVDTAALPSTRILHRNIKDSLSFGVMGDLESELSSRTDSHQHQFVSSMPRRAETPPVAWHEESRASMDEHG